MIIGFVESYGALLAVRFMLGIAETALLPGLAFWMSRCVRSPSARLIGPDTTDATSSSFAFRSTS